jgi:hypothetical protein
MSKLARFVRAPETQIVAATAVAMGIPGATGILLEFVAQKLGASPGIGSIFGLASFAATIPVIRPFGPLMNAMDTVGDRIEAKHTAKNTTKVPAL